MSEGQHSCLAARTSEQRAAGQEEFKNTHLLLTAGAVPRPMWQREEHVHSLNECMANEHKIIASGRSYIVCMSLCVRA